MTCAPCGNTGDDFEREAIAEQRALSSVLPGIYAKDPDTAINLARGFSTGMAQRAVVRADQTRDTLMTNLAVAEGQHHAEQIGGSP